MQIGYTYTSSWCQPGKSQRDKEILVLNLASNFAVLPMQKVALQNVGQANAAELQLHAACMFESL